MDSVARSRVVGLLLTLRLRYRSLLMSRLGMHIRILLRSVQHVLLLVMGLLVMLRMLLLHVVTHVVVAHLLRRIQWRTARWS